MKTVDTFLLTLPVLRRARAGAALNRQMRLDGVYMWRRDAALKLLPRYVRVDGGRFHTVEGTFYEVRDLTKTLVDFIRYLHEE